MKKIAILLCMLSPLLMAQEVTFELTIEIPKHNVSEYHAPYIATWVENENRQAVKSTSLWYDDQLKWLKDIRQWWRKTGRRQTEPFDGITGATRRPGTHKLVLEPISIENDWPPGNYQLMVEAAREVGGREVVSLPFEWPATTNQIIEAAGNQELGTIKLNISVTQ